MTTCEQNRLEGLHQRRLNRRLPASKIAILVAAFALTNITPVCGETVFWTPQGHSQDWFGANNWGIGAIPGTNDNVVQARALNPITLANGSGPATIEGLLLTGGGALRTGGNALVVNRPSDTSLTRINTGGLLVVEAGSATGRDADLDTVQVEFGELRLAGGIIHVDHELSIDAASSITGNGRVLFNAHDENDEPTVLEIGGAIRPNGGILRFETHPDARISLHGSNTAALLDVTNGDLELAATIESGASFNGALSVAPGRTATFERRINFDASSTISLQGGAPDQPASLHFAESSTINSQMQLLGTTRISGKPSFREARLQINGTMTASGEPTFKENSHVSLPSASDRLLLQSFSIITGNSADQNQPGVTFAGDGKVVNGISSEALLINNPSIDVAFENSGLVDLLQVSLLTLKVGSANFESFRQTSTGTLKFDLSSFNDTTAFDRYVVNGEAELDGSLDVNVVRLLTEPLLRLEAGDSFEILSAAGGVTGTFSNTSFPLAPTGTEWRLRYGDTSVVLDLINSSAFLGDFDGNGLTDCADVDALVADIAAGTNSITFDMTGDGSVDQADLTQWLATAGVQNLTSGNPIIAGDANLDGVVDALDFIVWSTNKFTSTAAWCSGDFNADGAIDGHDFLVWNANKFTIANSFATTVPEPAMGLVWILTVAVLAGRSSRTGGRCKKLCRVCSAR